jgi:dipeptidyl aminopeptidase/acylaminoacyl peptidase
MKNNYLGPKKREARERAVNLYKANIKTLRERGFEVFPVNYHGKVPMGWTFALNGNRSVYAWDCESSVINYLLELKEGELPAGLTV